MAEPSLTSLPVPRPPMAGVAPPPVPTARPTPPTRQGSTGPASYVTKVREAMGKLVEAATENPELVPKLSPIVGQLTDLIEEDAQTLPPDEGEDMPDRPAPAMPRPPLQSPTLRSVPPLPRG